MLDSSKSLAARLKRQRNQRGATLIPVRRLANPVIPRLKRSAIECGGEEETGRREGRKNDGWKKSHEGRTARRIQNDANIGLKASWIWNHHEQTLISKCAREEAERERERGGGWERRCLHVVYNVIVILRLRYYRSPDRFWGIKFR